MITKTKQDWSVGCTVKVGFMTLVVFSVKGNDYTLRCKKNNYYSFVPHVGLTRIDAPSI